MSRAKRSTLSSLLAALLLSGCVTDAFIALRPEEADPDVGEPPPSRFAGCAGSADKLDWSLYAKAGFDREPAPGLTADQSVPVSPQGCVRYTRRIENGRVTQLTTRRALGFMEAYVPSSRDPVVWREAELVLSKYVCWPGGSRAEFDCDADGFVETVVESKSANRKRVSKITTVFDRATREVAARTCWLAEGEPGKLRFKQERRIDGRLVTVRDDIVDADQNPDDAMGQTVGALCKTPDDSVSWNQTLAACQSTCTGGPCKSYSLSCDPHCN